MEEHVKATVFASPVCGQTMANCGVITMRVGEWQVFGAALGLGFDRIPKSHGTVEFDDTEFVRFFHERT